MTEPRPVPLAHRAYGDEGPPLVILHGLLGSSRNWGSPGRKLAERFTVGALDLRNHGASPHAAATGFGSLAADVEAWLDERGVERPLLMGHSLGGKVAMRLACDRPDRIGALALLDIAPRAYAPDPTILDALLAVDLEAVNSRAEVEEALAAAVPDLATRLFLLTNLTRGDDDGFRWQVNLPALRAALTELSGSPLAADERYPGPTLVIAGGRSPYVAPGDHDLIRSHFPAAEIEVLEEAGHNVHTEALAEFVERVVRFAERHRLLLGG